MKKLADIRDVKFRLVGEHANLFIPRARTLLRRAHDTVFPAQQSVHIKEHGVEYKLQQYHGQYIVDIILQSSQPVAVKKEDQYHWFVGIPMAQHVMLDASGPSKWASSGFGISGVNTDLLNKEFPQGIYGAYKYAFWRYDRTAKKIVCSIKPYKEVSQSKSFDGGRFCISNAKSDPAYAERYYQKGNTIISWHGSHSWLDFNANLVLSFGFPPGWILQQFQRSRNVYKDGHLFHTMPTVDIRVIISNNEFNPQFAVAAAALHKSGKVACIGAIGFLDFPCFLYAEGLPPSPLANQGLLITLGDKILFYGDYNIYGIGSTVRFEYESDSELKTAPFLLGVHGVNKWATVTITDSGSYSLDIGDDFIDFPALDFNYQALGSPDDFSVTTSTGSTNGTEYIWYTAVDAAVTQMTASIGTVVPNCPSYPLYAAMITNNPNFFVDGQAGSNVELIRHQQSGITTYSLFNHVGTEYTFDEKIILYKGITDKPGVISEVTYAISNVHDFKLSGGSDAGSLILRNDIKCKRIDYKAYAIPLPGCPSGNYLVYKAGEPPPQDQHVDNIDSYHGQITNQFVPEQLVYKITLNNVEFAYTSDFDYTTFSGLHRVYSRTGHGVSGGCGMGSYTGPVGSITDFSNNYKSDVKTTGQLATIDGQAAIGALIHPDTGLNCFVERIVTVTHYYQSGVGAIDTVTETVVDYVVTTTHTNVPIPVGDGHVTLNIAYKLYLKDYSIEFYNKTEEFSYAEYPNIHSAIDLYAKSSRYVINRTFPSSYVYATRFTAYSLPVVESDDREARPWFACVRNDTDNTVFITFYDEYVAGIFQHVDSTLYHAGSLVSYNRIFDIADTVKDIGDPIEALVEYTSEENNPNALWRMEGEYPWVYKLGII